MVQALMKAFRDVKYPRERMQETKRQTRFTYTDGPMYYLGLQIVKAMQDAGYPAKISECYRSPERQDELYARKRTKAKRWQSPHQYLEAVDIIHPSLGWNVSPDYWDALNACAQIVAEKHGVELEYGYDWGWDMAHIEIKDWREVRERLGPLVPTPRNLWDRFKEVLPNVAKQHQKSPYFSEPLA